MSKLNQKETMIVTGGAGFIGANFIKIVAHNPEINVINIDDLTYASNLETLKDIAEQPNYTFIKTNICDHIKISEIIRQYQPTSMIHFAAESHVDRSIEAPDIFLKTNIEGTFILLNEAKKYWLDLSEDKKNTFRFIHISTDEVYGSLEKGVPPFKETNPYQPNSPYSASKAASDHLARAWFHTYHFPVITTNCSNNYGPYQFPEKLIPLCIQNALSLKPLPIYGDGSQIRDWLFVKDHCKAILHVLKKGKIGEVYNIGGWNEKTNLDVVKTICTILDDQHPRTDGKLYEDLITFVKDRPGHDKRYAIDASKLYKELHWKPEETFETGIKKTVIWYLNNQNWIDHIDSGQYHEWVEKQYQL